MWGCISKSPLRFVHVVQTATIWPFWISLLAWFPCLIKPQQLAISELTFGFCYTSIWLVGSKSFCPCFRYSFALLENFAGFSVTIIYILLLLLWLQCIYYTSSVEFLFVNLLFIHILLTNTFVFHRSAPWESRNA